MKLQHPGLMKVWTSPVFHFGVLLAVAVVGLLLAPFVIDWNGYRGDLEAYGKKLTGREVTIEGPISARLFPWPRLTAERIAIANPPGLAQEKFATAERVTIHVTLAGLMQGSVDVKSIDVDQPTVKLERLETGEGNWQFTPSEDLVRGDILSRVRLDQITLTGGTLAFTDARRGKTATLRDFNASVSSPGIAGPWRMRSRSLYNDRPIDIAVNTGSHVPGEPFRFGVTLSAGDGSGYVFGFDGAAIDGKADGSLRIAPANAEGGKSDAEGRIRPLVFSAKVKGDFDRVDFEGIEVSRLEAGETGAFVNGSAALRFGSRIEAEANLKAAMLDVDTLAGAQSRDILRQAGSLAVVGGVLDLLPADMSLSGKLDVTVLKTGGQNLDNVKLAIEAERGELRIGRFSAGLPGRSDVLFKGLYLPGAGGGELSGDMALETSDLRELALWLWPEGRPKLSAMWNGSRGRLKMQTDISLTPSRLTLGNSEFELDGARGKGSLSMTAAGRGSIDLALDGNRFDLDSYALNGIPALPAAAREGAGGLLALALPHTDAPDLKLQFKAGELVLNAVTAQDVSVDLQSGGNGLDLRALDIGSVGGAKVVASGLILDTGKGADGTIGLSVEAGDPSQLIMLLGLGGQDGLPAWAQGLGETAVRASLAVRPSAQGSEFFFRASGSAGELNIAGEGTASPGMALSGNLAVTAPSSGRILSLFGVASRGPDTEPGALRIDATGTPAEGFTADATLQVHGARLAYRGAASPWAEGFGLDGQLSLRAQDASEIIAASGVPAAVNAAGELSGDARLAWAEGKWTLSDIKGHIGSETFAGTASLTPALQTEARISTGPLRLAHVMAGAFLDWSGPAPNLEAGFAAALPFGLTGEIWLDPSALEVHPSFTTTGAQIGIAAKPGELRLSMFGKDPKGRGAQIEIMSAGADASRNLTGMLSVPVDLREQMALASGAPVAEGQGKLEMRFEAEGRSPAGALAAVRGSGSYSFDDLRLLNLTPAAFAAVLAEAKDAGGISRAFDALRSGEGLDFGAVTGTIEVSEGQVNFAPLGLRNEVADVEVRTVAELALAQIDVGVSLKLKAREGLPPMNVSYAGPPLALSRAEDSTELSTALGVTIMQQGIDELERLQQEQARLAEVEEQQRIEDEARLQAYYAQRDELLLRRRELKVQAEMQVMEADRLRRQIELERAANTEINKIETRQRQREIRVWRRQAKLTQAAPPPKRAPEPISASVEPAPVPIETQAVSAPKPTAPRAPQPIEPLILENPPGAPVIISPLPPSQ